MAGIYPFNLQAVDERKLFLANLFMARRDLQPPEIADARVTTDSTPTKPKSMVTSTTMATTATATMATTTPPLTSGTKKMNAPMVPSSIVFGGKRFQLVEMGTTENETKDKVLDDVLKAPGEANQKEQGQTGSRLSGLPRCISSKAYRDLIMQKEEVKKKIEEEKEKRKCEHEEAKAKKIAEKEERE